jgi:hypothetical protein
VSQSMWLSCRSPDSWRCRLFEHQSGSCGAQDKLDLPELPSTGGFGIVVVENTVELIISGDGVMIVVTVLALGTVETLLLSVTTIDAVAPAFNGPNTICGANSMIGGGDC